MMKTTTFRATTALVSSLLCLGVLLSSACSSDTTPEANDASGGQGDGGQGGQGNAAQGGSDSGLPTSPAVLIAGQVYSPEDYLTYVRIFPDVPEGDIGFESFREFGNANVSVHDGRVFVEQDGTMQRFSVSEDLQLVDGPRFSWADLGIPSANATSTVFISGTRAYTFAPQLGAIVVWDPEEMVRTDLIELEFPERPAGMETWAYDGRVVGDKVIWNVFSGNWDTSEPYPAVTLAIADAHSDAAPTFVEDTRCLPGGPSFLDQNGDYYVHGGGYFGYFYAYGGVTNGRTCALRVKAGETELDPDYVLDYDDVMGTYVSTPWIGVTGNQYVARAWDPSVPFPEVPDDFWTVALRPLLVDASAGTAVPYPDVEGLVDIDGRTRIVDGVSYFQLSETGYEEGGNTDVVELHPEGILPKFHLSGGFLLELERVR